MQCVYLEPPHNHLQLVSRRPRDAFDSDAFVMAKIHSALLLRAIFYFLFVFTTASLASSCQPYEIDFSDPGKVSDYSSPRAGFSPFVGASPPESYSVDSEGLKLYLKRPEGDVKTKQSKTGRVNDKISGGATVNSTFIVAKWLFSKF